MSENSECLHERFERQAAATPDAPALTFSGETLSYAELNARSNQLARYLRECGVRREVLVGLCLDRGFDTVVAILAVLKAGGAYVPMDPVYPAERVRMIVEDAECPVVLCHAEYRERFDGGERIIVLDGGGRPWESLPESDLTPEANGSNLAYVIYTSGSTGRPKGVLISHENVLFFMHGMEHVVQVGNSDVWTLFHSYGFDYSVWEMWGALLYGGRLVIIPHLTSRSPEIYYRLLVEEGVTVLNQTPAAFNQLQYFDETRPPSDSDRLALRYVILGGETLDLPSLSHWIARHGDQMPKLVNLYGITETTVVVTYRPISIADTKPGTPNFIGGALPGYELCVLDENRRPVAVGETGELYVGGRGVGRGYLRRPELTAERFISDLPGRPGIYYKTGDLVRLHEGDLEFLGRNDMQVQLRGFRLELGEIETALGTHPLVRGAVVRLREDVPGDPRLVAYYLAKEALPVETLRQHLQRTLPPYMVPSAFVHLDAFPLNNNGKVDSAALPAPPATGGTYVAPRDGIESGLAVVWEEVLRTGRVGASDNFFALGGHSLLATRILIRIRERFGVNLTLREFYEAPTVAELARAVEAIPRAGAAADCDPPRAPRDAPLPLSFPQEQLWILQQLRPGLCAYNIPMRIDLRGALRPDMLERALGEVVARHEALRTLFVASGGHPEARVLPALDIPVTLKSLAGDTDALREASLQDEAKALAGVPMDLAQGPLLRAALYTMAPEHHVLVLVIHHVVFDGWSVSILVSDIADAYHALCAGTEWRPTPLEFQYADYAAWQRGYTASPAFQDDIAYWKRNLAGPLPVLELPTDFARPAVQAWEGARVRHRLSPDVLDRINALAQSLAVTPFAVLLAGWKALLFRRTGQEDCIVGAAMAGRDLRAWEPLVGFFVNTVALRTRIDRELSFARYVERVQEAVLAAGEHQRAPFERVVAEVRRERDPARPPVFQAMVVLHNTPDYGTARGGVTFHAEEMDNGCAKFELTLAMQPAGGGLELNLEYNTSLFKRETVEGMLNSFASLLDCAAGDPSRAVDALEVAPGGEDPAAARPHLESAEPHVDPCLHQVFESQVDRTPGARAVTCEGVSLTYGELNARANRLARHLQSMGAGPDVLVGLCLDRSIDIVVAILAVLKSGSAYVPMDPVYPAERVRLIVEDAQCPIVLVHSAYASRFDGGGARVVVLDGPDAPRETGDASNLPCAANASSLAYVIYTSGSTGKPKGVLISHQNVTFLMRGMEHVVQVGANDVWTLFHSYAFDFSVWEMWGAFFYGGRLVVVPHLISRSPENFHRLLAVEAVTVLNQTPSAFKQLQHYDESLPPGDTGGLSLRYVIFGGETLDLPGLSGWFERHGDRIPALVNMYGITETTVFVTYRPISIADTKPGTPNYIGLAIPGYELCVLDDGGLPVSAGGSGEIYVGGGGVARGYLRRPELTAERFIAGLPDSADAQPGTYYKTGDLVRVHDGDLEFLCRNDMQVQLRGFRVELGEIEAALGAHASIRGAVVRMREDTPGDQRLAAYYLAREPVPATELRAHLAQTLPEYMLPSAFVHLDAFPLNNNGKLDTGALPAPRAETAPQATEAPANPTESQIAEIWCALLRIPEVGRSDDFFAIGGHSLLAIQLVARINEAMKSNVSLEEFFDAPTVAGVGALLAPQEKSPDSASRKLLEIKSGSRVPFFCVKGAGDIGGSYETLAGALSESQPFYGFPSLELDEGTEGTVESIASQCIREMRKVRPKGPYYIGGYSFGGVVAYEMARQLIATGESVPFIAMLDSSTPEHGFVKREISLQFAEHLINKLRARLSIIAHTWKMHAGYARDALRLLCRRMTGSARAEGAPRWRDYFRWIMFDSSVQYFLIHAGLATSSFSDRRLEMLDNNLVRNSNRNMISGEQAMAQYKIQAIPAEITLFRAEHDLMHWAARDPSFGWSKYAGKGVRIVVVPGNHMVIIRHPYAKDLGKALQRAIDALEEVER